MNPNGLFLETVRDLEQKIQSQDRYEVLMITALLRKLLLDGAPLVDRVNRAYKQKIFFTINDRKPAAVGFWSIEDGLDPDTSRNSASVRVSKDQLLTIIVLKTNGSIVTIKELILHVAHVQGGVHAGVPNDQKDKILDEMMSTLGIGGLPAGFRLIKAIARVVCKGLQPLKTEVVANPR